jgi:isoamylase
MHCFGMLLDGRGQETGIKRQAGDASLLLVTNSYHDVVKFTLPQLVGGSRWLCMLDTNQPERSDTPAFDVGQVYDVTGRSFLLLAGLTVGGPGRAVQRIALELTARAARD